MEVGVVVVSGCETIVGPYSPTVSVIIAHHCHHFVLCVVIYPWPHSPSFTPTCIHPFTPTCSHACAGLCLHRPSALHSLFRLPACTSHDCLSLAHPHLHPSVPVCPQAHLHLSIHPYVQSYPCSLVS